MMKQKKVLDKNNQKLFEFLNGFGLTNNQIHVYIALSQNGEMTVSEIANSTEIPRTTVYREIEQLTKIGLIQENIKDFGSVYTTSNLYNLRKLLDEKQQTLNRLKHDYHNIIEQLHNNEVVKNPKTQIKYYQGQNRVRLMLWNILKASEIYALTYRTTRDLTGKEFNNYLHKEMQLRQIKVKELYSDGFIEFIGRDKFTKPTNTDLLESRYIPSDRFSINQQMDIYDNVVSIYSWHNDEIFGIEIYNEDFADYQRQVFEILWEISSQYN